MTGGRSETIWDVAVGATGVIGRVVCSTGECMTVVEAELLEVSGEGMLGGIGTGTDLKMRSRLELGFICAAF